MNLLKIILSLSVIIALFASCESEMESPVYKQQLIFDMDNGVFNTNTFIESSDAHSGKVYSRANVGNNYGFGYKYILPDSLIGKTIAVDVSAWVRTGDITNNCDIAFSVYSKDSSLIWNGCNIKEVLTTPNTWSYVNRTFTIGSDLTEKGDILINVMAHNIEAKSFLDIDDVSLTVYELNNN